MTRRLFGPALVVGSVFVFIACSERESGNNPPAQDDAGSTDASDPVSAEVTRRFEEAAASGFSGSALVTVGGRQVLAAGYGMANRETQTPNGVDTAFDFGSVMKDFTAAAIFRLAGDGKLATSDPLSEIFPDAPADKAAITVLQILHHRAGFAEYHDEEGDFEAMTRLEARAKIFAQPLRFAPGTDESYSNSGFTLLADIVETVSGKTFTDYVRDSLFVPAEMKSTGFFGDPLLQQLETATGYDAETFGANNPAAWPYTWALVGNGGLVMTVGDLDRWASAVWNGNVLPGPAFAAYRADYLDPTSRELEGATVYTGAGGGDYGLGGLIVDCPAKRTRIVIATNTLDSFDIEPFALDLARFVLVAR
jgi:CubicO group peptidase (beta-lactamase class C family)